MGVHLQTHPNRTNPCWDDLDAIEQSLLVVAARERMLDQACPAWADRPRRDGAIELTKQAARGLLHRGLIGFFRVSEGYPDLSENDLGLVFRGRSYWDCADENSRQVGLFLTTAGEDVVLGP